MINFVTRFLHFFKRRILLGHVSGIPVQIDYRWIIVVLVLAFLVSASIPEELVSFEIARFALGLTAVFTFFGTLFLHELSHAYVARREGIAVLEIFLHPFGGVARLRKEPDTPGAEFRIAIAGPVISLTIAFVFLALFGLSSLMETNILTPLFFLLFLLNLLLAIFNLFPGIPLDGGRVLRALLWRRGMEFGEATVLTGKFGQIIAFALMFFGITIIVLTMDFFTGLWTIIVGFFLLDSSTGFIRQVHSFDNLIVEQVMEMPISVSPDISVMDCVDKVLPYNRQTIFPAALERQLYGFFVLRDIKETLPKNKWRETLVRDVMRPIKEEYFVEPDTPVPTAKELMKINGLGALAVIDSAGCLVGFLARGRIRRRS